MNCQDIARLLDEQEVDGLLASEQSDVQSHLATCRDCARDWQIHAQLQDAAIPAVPAELRAHYAAQVMDGANLGARRSSRLVVIGTLVAVAAAASMLTLRKNEPSNPVAATADPVRVEPSGMQGFSETRASPTEPLSDDEEKAYAQWTRRVADWLAIRDDPDALITAALLLMTQPPDAQRIQLLLQRATAMAPESARIHATAMRLCFALMPCDATPYEQALRRLAPHNALGWIGEVQRSSGAGDNEALQRALTAMSRAETFDLYWGAIMLSMIPQISAALVAPPDIKRYGASLSNDLAAGTVAAMANPAFQPITKTCLAATNERELLECRRIGAAMRAGDTVLINAIGLTISGYGLAADSAEARLLAQEKNRVKWILHNLPQETDLPADDPRGMLRALADHPREIDALRAMLEAQGIPTEPPADWK